MLAIHEVRTVADVKEDKACRTKLVVRADAENYNFDRFGWHWITVRGDFRKEVLNLTLLWGLEIIEEDKMYKIQNIRK